MQGIRYQLIIVFSLIDCNSLYTYAIPCPFWAGIKWGDCIMKPRARSNPFLIKHLIVNEPLLVWWAICSIACDALQVSWD